MEENKSPAPLKPPLKNGSGGKERVIKGSPPNMEFPKPAPAPKNELLVNG